MREETLVRNLLQYKRVLEAMLIAMVGDRPAAEDLYQEMAILMTRKREGVDEDCRFIAWGRRIAVNLVRDHRKRLARQNLRPLDDEILDSVARVYEEAGESAWEERLDALRRCAGLLPEKDRGLLRRRYELDEPADSIARDLSTSRGAVDNALYRLRKSLHDCVELRLQEPGRS
ncbi:MAG TPA: sigma-70 family RNA polymerase sigma factor [Planctomycetota bacterium]|nr:sigma-70 family RNA polymerase sigma factor [Planctomycetota bacterium]